jgi:hypothetical protein
MIGSKAGRINGKQEIKHTSDKRKTSSIKVGNINLSMLIDA